MNKQFKVLNRNIFMQLYSKIDGKKVTFTTLDELVPSTITALFEYDGEINLNNVFLTLITEKKENIPDNGFGIYFVKFKRKTRGYNMKETLEEKDYFKKSVTISIVYKGNNISVKLAESVIHICGLKSLDFGYEIVSNLMDKIHECQNLIKFIQANKKKLNSIIDTIKNNCIFKNNKVVFPFTVIKLNPAERDCINMIYNYSNYMPSLNKYISHLEDVFNIEDDIVIRKPEIFPFVPVMRNYIYTLGVPINRIVLAIIINNESSKFMVKYNNSTQHFVRIKVPFTEEEMKVDKHKNKKKRFHHFFIYKTGTISQSGMDFKVIKQLFSELTGIIEKYYVHITNMNMDFLLENNSDTEEEN